jgi:hypothetical protein
MQLLHFFRNYSLIQVFCSLRMSNEKKWSDNVDVTVCADLHIANNLAMWRLTKMKTSANFAVN